MIHRIDVQAASLARKGPAAVDPLGEAIRHQIEEFSGVVGPITTARIFLIDADVDGARLAEAAHRLLADPLVDAARVIDSPPDDADKSRIEIHLKPGVMDPVAASTEMALRDMGVHVKEVRTGRAYLIHAIVPRDELRMIASRVLANGVIESVHFDCHLPTRFESARDYAFCLRHVELRMLNDAELMHLSRKGHLFLSLAEMKAIQGYFREQKREPTDVELETLAQTWSEHCVHKTLKSAVDVEVVDAEGRTVATRRYDNLIRDTIFQSTVELMRRAREAAGVAGAERWAGDFCLSVFKDNAGVIAFDDVDAVCFKVETHNHPSAIEPYGGSATGIGGVIRDILGTGLSAKPIANTDVFCVANPDYGKSVAKGNASANGRLPKGVIHPKRILQQVTAGVRDYGNRMGIPTVNGAVYFDDRYLGNPLVFCGCVGLIPRDKIEKETGFGDAIVVMGGRTGRDGIHGATFSSAELTDTHADEFSHAVQIGNAITEKKIADVILQARDRGLFSAITDCGAGGLSSAVGEMADKTGAEVDLDKAPLKYAGLRYDEIWISEAQERMVLSVPRAKLAELLALAEAEDVETTVIGTFGEAHRELVLRYDGQEVARMAMQFIHHGIPMPTRRAVVAQGAPHAGAASAASDAGRLDVRQTLLSLLSHPNVASKHWIIRQYDHEVQGGSVVKPLIGRRQMGPSDASVIRPKLSIHRGVVVGCGLSPQIEDPYEMALAAIDEAVRNVTAVGADPAKVAILDNFCWPSVDDEKTMGTLVRACEACRDAALAYGTPFISGKDSLHNQFTDRESGRVIRIPRTLLISAIGVIDDVRRCVTMDLKEPDSGALLRVGPRSPGLDGRIAVHHAVAGAIAQGLITACHDVSDGGWLTAVAEMCIASGFGAAVTGAPADDFHAERSAEYVIEVARSRQREAEAMLTQSGADVRLLGSTSAEARLVISVTSGANGIASPDVAIEVEELTRAWRGALDW